MDLHLIQNVKKFKAAIGIILDTVMINHTLFTFPTAKAFTSGRIIICEMWVEWLANEWIATSSPTFATAWPEFLEVCPL